MNGWIEPSNRALVAEYWLTRKSEDVSPGSADCGSDIRVRYRWNGHDSWWCGETAWTRNGDERRMVCLHGNNGWRLVDDAPLPISSALQASGGEK